MHCRNVVIALAVLALASAPAAAATFCVSNSSELASALQTASTNADANDLIKLRGGTYVSPAGGFGRNDQFDGVESITIEGGWGSLFGNCDFSTNSSTASIIDGALLSGARLVRYPHNDAVALAGLMEKQRGTGRCLIVSDGVFSMDGDLAPLAELAELKRRHDALLMVDDAHGCGVLGEQGRGSAELLGVLSHIDIHVGTFGKALGSFGAYAALSRELRDLLVNRARSFIFSTSLPPAVLAASTAALELVQAAEGDGLRKRLRDNTSLFRGMLRDAGFSLGEGNTQIVPTLTGGAEETMDFSRQLLEEGIFVQGIRPPTVPAGACRLRCTVMATHAPQDLTWAAERITHIGRRLGVI